MLSTIHFVLEIHDFQDDYLRPLRAMLSYLFDGLAAAFARTLNQLEARG